MENRTRTSAREREDRDAPSRREERRIVRHDVARHQLLDAAEEVFGEKGFHDTTLKEVAELAEFAVGSVYSFFASKEDLYLQVFLRRGEEFLPGMASAVEASTDPHAQLHALVDFEVGFFRRHPRFGRLYVRAASTPLPGPETPTSSELRANFERAMEIHSEVFRAGQRAGVICEGDTGVLARILSGIVLAYQSVDRAVLPADEVEGELPLDALHELVDGAFGSR